MSEYLNKSNETYFLSNHSLLLITVLEWKKFDFSAEENKRILELMKFFFEFDFSDKHLRDTVLELRSSKAVSDILQSKKIIEESENSILSFLRLFKILELATNSEEQQKLMTLIEQDVEEWNNTHNPTSLISVG